MELLISSVLDAESTLPSFFEMAMIHQVQLSLKSALRHGVGAISIRLPLLYRVLPFFEEIYLAVSLLLEGEMLANHNCLLSESLYGFKRSKLSGSTFFCQYGASSVASSKELAPLSVNDKRMSLLLTTMLPYVKVKLDSYYTRRKDESDAAHTDPEVPLSNKARHLLLFVYPIFHAAYEGSFLLFQWMYLLNRSVYFSPMQALVKQIVRRVTREELDLPLPQTPASGASHSITNSRVFSYGKGALIAAVIFYKLAEWWAHSDSHGGNQAQGRIRRQKRIPGGGGTLPPPLPPPTLMGGLIPPSDRTLCPICCSPRINPSFCVCSGYVFCYRCIMSQVRDKKQCPITLRPCSEKEIVRIYDEKRQ